MQKQLQVHSTGMSVPQSRSFTKFRPSSVEESLFGTRRVIREKEEPCREFNPPWVKEKDGGQRTARPLLFYCPSAVASNIEFQSRESKQLERSNTPRQNQGRSPAKKKNLRPKFSPSFVDESLFKSPRDNSMGDKTTDFDPPWVEHSEKSPRPILFDYSGSRPSTCLTDRSSVSRNSCDDSVKRRSSHSSGITRSKSTDKQKIAEARKPWR